MEFKFNLENVNPDNETTNTGKLLAKNILEKKHLMVGSIRKFAKQQINDGIHSENIIRLLLDGVNLNHFHKNHPYVDIGIVPGQSIPGITVPEEIISIKSTIKFKNISQLLSWSKSIKIESLFSYLMFAFHGYDDYTDSPFSPVSLLKNVNTQLKDVNLSQEDYKIIINIVIYYIMFENNKNNINNLYEDINNIFINKEFNITFGNYIEYVNKIDSELEKLKTPISLGIVYINPDNENEVIFDKTNPIELIDFWHKVLDEWCDKKYFGTEVVKYLKMDSLSKIFNLENEQFPIKISINASNYKYEYSRNRVDRAYVSTKLKDADFQDKESEVLNMFSREIGILSKKPYLITKFNDFIDDLNKS